MLANVSRTHCIIKNTGRGISVKGLEIAGTPVDHVGISTLDAKGDAKFQEVDHYSDYTQCLDNRGSNYVRLASRLFVCQLCFRQALRCMWHPPSSVFIIAPEKGTNTILIESHGPIQCRFNLVFARTGDRIFGSIYVHFKCRSKVQKSWTTIPPMVPGNDSPVSRDPSGRWVVPVGWGWTELTVIRKQHAEAKHSMHHRYII